MIDALIKRIEECRAASVNLWQLAIDTALPEQRADLERNAEACSDYYRQACADVLSGLFLIVGESLEEARSLEAWGGDDSPARQAIEAWQVFRESRCIEDDDIVTDVGGPFFFKGG
jgi:hypothetical protein